MATLTLDRIFVNLLSTGAAVSAQSIARDSQYTVVGDVETYAAGRQRAKSRIGESSQFRFTLRMVPAADVDTLRGWMRQPVAVRDHRGQRFVGTFFAVVPDEVKALIGTYDVGIVLKSATTDEEV